MWLGSQTVTRAPTQARAQVPGKAEERRDQIGCTQGQQQQRAALGTASSPLGAPGQLCEGMLEVEARVRYNHVPVAEFFR